MLHAYDIVILGGIPWRKERKSDNERLRRLVIDKIFEVIHIYIFVHKIHLASSKYFTTNGSVSTPIAFPMDKSLDISVFSFRLPRCPI